MNQIIADKMKREVMVVANSALFDGIPRESKVYSTEEADFESKILKNFEFMIRGEAEENRDYKQPITYAIVLNEHKQVFVYIRGWADSAAGDTRLHEKLSIWVGGHLEREEEESENPLRDCLEREMEEEIALKETHITDIFPIGYINDDRNDVGEVHLGVVYVIRTEGFQPSMKDGELAQGEFMDYTTLTSLSKSGKYDVETWTQLLEPVVEKYI